MQEGLGDYVRDQIDRFHAFDKLIEKSFQSYLTFPNISLSKILMPHSTHVAEIQLLAIPGLATHSRHNTSNTNKQIRIKENRT
jgi:hypothetical protein